MKKVRSSKYARYFSCPHKNMRLRHTFFQSSMMKKLSRLCFHKSRPSVTEQIALDDRGAHFSCVRFSFTDSR